MLNKKDLIRQLRRHPTYIEAMKMLSTDEARAKAQAFAESFLVQFVDALGPVAAHVSRDKAFADQLSEALTSQERVVSDEVRNESDETRSDSDKK